MKEKIASVVHDTWTHWMSYLFSQSIFNSDGSVTIPKDKVDRWMRQMRTAYEDLSREEQLSDLAEVDQYIECVHECDAFMSEFCLDPSNAKEEYILGDSYPILVKGGI
jgi:hypothetical protein